MIVMVGLGPTIHPTACSGASGELDPRDKPEDDSGAGPARRRPHPSQRPHVDWPGRGGRPAHRRGLRTRGPLRGPSHPSRPAAPDGPRPRVSRRVYEQWAGCVARCAGSQSESHLPRLRLSPRSAPVRQRCASEMRVRFPCRASSQRRSRGPQSDRLAGPGARPAQRHGRVLMRRSRNRRLACAATDDWPSRRRKSYRAGRSSRL